MATEKHRPQFLVSEMKKLQWRPRRTTSTRCCCARLTLPGVLVLILAGGSYALAARPGDDRPEFVATAWIHLAFQEPQILGSQSDRVATSRDAFEFFRRTQAVLLQSSVVLKPALSRPEINSLKMVERHKDDAVAWLEEAIEVDFPGDAEIIRVRLRGDDPRELEKLLNAVLDTYTDASVEKDQIRRLTRIRDLEKLFSQSEQIVQSKRSTIRDLADRAGTGDPKLSMKHQLKIKLFEALNAELIRLRIERLRAQGRLRARQASAEPTEEVQRELAEIKEEVNSLAEQEKSVQSEVSELEDFAQEIERINQDTIELEFMRKELGQTESIHNRALTELTALNVELQAEPRISIIQRADARRSKGNH